jgi:outer membrane immunogenic protein
MTRLLLTTAALVAIVMSGAANAADLPLPPPVYSAPPPPVVYNWTGCYVGAGYGYGMWTQDTTAVNPAGSGAQQTTNGGKGWFGQGQVGCDYQFRMPLSFWSPNVVIGAFADYEFAGSGLRGTLAVPATGSFGAENMPWTWAAGARAGVLVTPKFLTYFDAGYTQANFSGVNFLNSVTGASTGVSVAANTYNGWFLGSGFEYGFDIIPGLFFKTEYRYSSFNTANLPVLTGGAPNGFVINSTKFTQMISTELVYRFNWFGH